MAMKRKVYSELLDWKKGGGESALLIEGARRVGKTFIAEEFGRNEYRSYIVVDFTDDQVIEAFEQYHTDFDLLFSSLSAIYNTKLYRRESLIVFDEIQNYLEARQLIKKLVKDRRYDYIETGSLVSILTKSSNILIPSEEDRVEMHPMDFEEFLWAMGEDQALGMARDCFEKMVPMGDAVHKKMMRLFKQYVLVGGMPQAVSKYLESRDFDDADRAKRRILGLYREDIGKWANGNTNHVHNVFDRIPEELNRKDKVFTLSSIDKNARMREYEDSFMWLVDGRIVNLCLNSNNPEIGLSVYSDRPTLKCYMADTGLLVTHAFSDRKSMENELYKAILLDGIGINEGMLMENVVAQTLVSIGDRLFFYSRGREDPDGQMDIDFLIRRNGRICPIEVKSSKRSRDHKSLDRFRERFGKRLGQSYVIHSKDLSVENGIVYLPVYMTMFL